MAFRANQLLNIGRQLHQLFLAFDVSSEEDDIGDLVM